MSDIEREAFEQWYKREFGRRPTITGYESDITWRAWQRATWQAARQAPEPVALDDAMTDDFKAAWKNGLPLSSAEAKWAFVGWQARSEAPASGDVALVADWSNRNTDSHQGWVNELLTLADHPEKIPAFARSAMRTIARGLSYTHPPAKVPEGLRIHIERMLELHERRGVVLSVHMQELEELLTTPTTATTAGAEWVRFEGDFDHPTEKMADEAGNIWAFDGVVELIHWQDFNAEFHTHYRATGLTRPTPPQETDNE